MRSFIRSHLSYANAMATIAVFMAMAGTGIAAKSYVITSSKQIKDGAVTGADVKNSSLTGTDIKNKSLTASDFNGPVQGPQGIQGSPGVQGPRGDPGAAGEKGEPGTPDGYTRTEADSAFIKQARLVIGSANPYQPANATILTLPEMNVTLTTDGQFDADLTVRIVNQSTTGRALYVANDGAHVYVLAGSTGEFTASGSLLNFALSRPNADSQTASTDTTPAVFVRCAVFVNPIANSGHRIRCIATREQLP